MNKLLLVIKHELVTVITRRSFLLTLVLIPLGAFLLLWAVNLIKKADQTNPGSDIISQLILPAQSSLKEGFVDEGNFIKYLPPEALEVLIEYPDESLARSALAKGEISSFFILPSDFITTGEIINIRNDFNPLTAMTTSTAFRDLVEYNLVEGDTELGIRITNPINLRSINIKPQPERDRTNLMTFFLPYFVTMIFYFVIMGSATLMLSSVTKEKINCTMEILMTSITPRQMLTGKIIALGLAGLLQTVVWTTSGYFLLGASRSLFNISATFQLAPSVLIWGITFFIGGFALYASLMAGVGALVPNLREATQATTVLILPMVIPLVIIGPIIGDPNGPLGVFFSMFPLTSPLTMMTRLAATTVPLWQVLLSLAVLFGTVILCVRAIASMFHAQNLLSGQTFRIGIFIKTMFRKG